MGREWQESNPRLQGFNLALQPTQLHSQQLARTEGLEPSLFGFVDRDVHPVTLRSQSGEQWTRTTSVNSICLANSAHRLTGLLSIVHHSNVHRSKVYRSKVGREGLEPPMSKDG